MTGSVLKSINRGAAAPGVVTVMKLLLLLVALAAACEDNGSPRPSDIGKFKESQLNFLPPGTPEHVKDMIRNWKVKYDPAGTPRCNPHRPRYAVEIVNPTEEMLQEQRNRKAMREEQERLRLQKLNQ